MRRFAAVAVALAAVLGLSASAPALVVEVGAGAPQVYTTGNAGELVSTLPVSKPPAPYGRAVIFCINLGDVPLAGEVLQVSAEAEFTNDLNINVNIETWVLLASDCTGNTGTEIVESNGTNCIPAAHHCSPTRAGAISVPAGNTFGYVVMVAFGQASYAQPGATVKVESDYGRLSVLRWR